MKKVLVAAAAAVTLAAPAVAQAHTPSLSSVQARNMAGSYALTHWQPSRVLPDYSQATSWDGINSNRCLRFGMYSLRCVVSVNAKNYYYDPGADEWTGYAYCVGTVYVTKNWHTGHISLSAPGFDPLGGDCDSTDDTPSASPTTPSTTSEGVGSYDHSGDAVFCSTHTCIGNFTTEPGYVVECYDGTYSHAGGIQGACSWHDGVNPYGI
jgi:hypothetical protein